MKKFVIYMSVFFSIFHAVGHSPDRMVTQTAGRASTATGLHSVQLYHPTELVYSYPENPCDEYSKLEQGNGSFERQDWFNHLDIPQYTKFVMNCVYHWDEQQFQCLDKLWWNESRWGDAAPHNIPQIKPDPRENEYRANQRRQAQVGLYYIDRRNDYRNPCDAWSLWQRRRPHWY